MTKHIIPVESSSKTHSMGVLAPPRLPRQPSNSPSIMTTVWSLRSREGQYSSANVRRHSISRRSGPNAGPRPHPAQKSPLPSE